LPFVFFDPPEDFFLFFDAPPVFFAPPSPLLFGGMLPVVEVGVAAWEGVVCADEGPGES